MAKRKSKKKKDYSIVKWIIILLALVVLGYFLYPRIAPEVKRMFSNRQAAPVLQNQQEQTNPLLEYTWVSREDGAMLELSKGGSFSVDFPSVDAQKKIFGHYKIVKNNIVFINHSSTGICVAVEGKYKFEVRDGRLNFELLGDRCKSRKKMMATTWIKL
jgi:hypothetical protein